MIPSDMTWYIRPKEGFSDEAIAKITPNEDQEEVTIDGERFILYRQQSWSVVDYLLRSKVSKGIDFTIYGQKGNGKIRLQTYQFWKNQRTFKEKVKKGHQAVA